MKIIYTVDDYVAAMRAHLVNRLRYPSRWWLYAALAGVLIAFADWILLGRAGCDRKLWSTCAGLSVLIAAYVPVWFLSVFAVNYIFAPVPVLRRFRQQKLNSEVTEVNFTDERIEMTAQSASNRIAWGDFHAWLAHGDGLLLYVNQDFYLVVQIGRSLLKRRNGMF